MYEGLRTEKFVLYDAGADLRFFSRGGGGGGGDFQKNFEISKIFSPLACLVPVLAKFSAPQAKF